MAVDLRKPAKGIEKSSMHTERRDFAEIVLATSNRIGIYGTRSTVNVSISL
jgi:hypothetical protein